MVFRKPYAFFIKNFRRIHFILIILCGFIYSRTLQLSTFNKDFITYLSYDPYFEPISKYLSIILYLAVIITIIGFLSIMIVLKRKDKPWKLYLIPVIEYIVLLIIYFYLGNFYNNYDGSFATTTIRALDNFLSIATVPQYVVFLILIIRVIGLDLKNFNFGADEEFLELDQDDREEFEISINFDKHAIKRNIKMVIRNLNYVYQEHKFICNVIVGIFIAITVYKTYYYFGVSHKTIKEDKFFNVNNYSMMINESFYTNKDKKGNILEKNSAFVILNITVINNGISRKFDGNDFHIVNGSSNYTYQGNTYSDDFSDIGDSFPTGKMKNGEKRNFALIFKVDKKLDYKKFVLYYQEYKGNISYLRKIKLNLNDVSKITTNSPITVGKELKIINPDKTEEEFTFESVEFRDSASYNIETCNQNDECSITAKEVTAPVNNKILYIEFTSPDYEGTDLAKFTTNYGKIIYTDNDGFAKEIIPTSVLANKDYLGKILYIKVPSNIESAKTIEFIYTVRNKKYSYKLR